jgi:hypothetical protein
MDGEVILDGLPFAHCERCRQIIVLDDDGLAKTHTTPCGAYCELSPYGEDARTCDGWCERCRTIVTGCAGDPDKPCGTPGCQECGVHIDESAVTGEMSPGTRAACRGNRAISRFAWTWKRVTCGGCLARQPAAIVA